MQRSARWWSRFYGRMRAKRPSARSWFFFSLHSELRGFCSAASYGQALSQVAPSGSAAHGRRSAACEGGRLAEGRYIPALRFATMLGTMSLYRALKPA